MRHQLLKLQKNKSTKSERRFLELLKQLRIPFRTKIKIEGREVDFLIGKYAIDIDCHEQSSDKNKILVHNGYIPIHYTNKEIDGGEENEFVGCVIGLDTIARSTTNAELELAGGVARNSFKKCLFTKQADNTGTLFVKSTGTSGIDRWNRFEDCVWYSFWTNDSDKIVAAFDLSAQTATGHIIMAGQQILIGADDWEAVASNRLYFEPATATTTAIGLAINNA